MNNRTIAVVNIFFGNRPRAGFEINHRQYCLRTNKRKKLIFPYLHEKSDTLKYHENIQVNSQKKRIIFIFSLKKNKIEKKMTLEDRKKNYTQKKKNRLPYAPDTLFTPQTIDN